MSKAKRDADAQFFGWMRNILTPIGFLFLPVATVFEVLFPGPSNMHTGMIVLFVIVGLIFLGLGGAMEALRRKVMSTPDEPEVIEALKAEHDAAAQESPQSGGTLCLSEVLLLTLLIMCFGIGLALFGNAFSQGTLADRFASEAEAYDMSSAVPADDMLQLLGIDATRAVRVTPAAGARGFPVICALNTDGALDLYRLRVEDHGSEVSKYHMGDTLRTAAEPFCDAAFERAANATSK